MIEQLKEQIKVVAKLRVASGTLNDKLKELREFWDAEHKNLLQSVAGSKDAVVEAEGLLREFTLEAYAETGDKTPAEGVGIREVTKLEYDTKTAYNWAIEHSMALNLDKRGFEKIAKVSDLDFVKTTTEPQATISQNLEIE